MALDIDKLKKEYDEWSTFSTTPKHLEWYGCETVFDPDKTVNWNRKEVKRRNTLYLAEVERLTEIYRSLKEKWYADMKKYISQQLHIHNEDTINRIYDFCYNPTVCDIRITFSKLNTVINIVKAVQKETIR